MSDNDVKKNNNNNESSASAPAYQTIREGSVEMQYPADQESTVFYNPVQVQNRDLSILMITLLAEERAVRLAVAAKKKQLRSTEKEQWKTKLQQFEQSLDPPQALRDQAPEDGMSILDALAASGLRSIRYWKEIPGVRHITINDLDAAAVERAHNNLKHNQVSEHVVGNDSNRNTNNSKDSSSAFSPIQQPQRPAGICAQQGDAIHEMYMSRIPASPDLPSASSLRPPWDVIDLDPYGSAAPFLDAAVQAIADGGLLCVTCTDMAALGGSHPETCYGRYAALPIQRAAYLQELALRILLQSLATTAAKYGRTITPRLSVGMNFYVRVFVTVHNNKAGVEKLSLSIGKVFQSTQCSSFQIVPDSILGGKKGSVYQAARAPSTCTETGGNFKIGGPLWLGPLHDASILEKAIQRLASTDPNSKPDLKLIATKDRLRGLLQNCADELPDVPLFYNVGHMASLLKVSSPPLDDVRAALMNGGYRVSGYHKDPQAIKTDAPSHVMWDILRTWCKKHPPKKPPSPDTAGGKILAKESCDFRVDFTHPKTGLLKRTDVARFPMNPEANWGPKKAATGHKRKAEDSPEKKENKK